MVGDVKGEGVVSAAVLSRLLAVDIDRGFPVGCLEMEEYAFACPVFGNDNILGDTRVAGPGGGFP